MPSFKKGSRGIIQPIAGGNMLIHTFPKSIIPKVNAQPQLELKIA